MKKRKKMEGRVKKKKKEKEREERSGQPSKEGKEIFLLCIRSVSIKFF